MISPRIILGTLLWLSAIREASSLGQDYIAVAPKTVYDADEKSPQNMDFDAENNMFVAHACFYNDYEVHYYKFRMYAPGTYPGLIAPGVSYSVIPMQKLYIVTTNGAMDGAIGMPIIDHHHYLDGTTEINLEYSDFMEIQLVRAPAGYVRDTYKSVGDIQESGARVTGTGIVVNLPVVPTGSWLQDPAKKEDPVAPKEFSDNPSAAPIAPTLVYYKGQEVWTYVFEVTHMLAAEYFSDTRADPNDPDYGVTVTRFATSRRVFAAPLWHLNQYTTGVASDNYGGPSSAGMRNVIDLDRPDLGYSPLWTIIWVTELPYNYLADEASNRRDMTRRNGFQVVGTPMWVNCPDIGPVSVAENPYKKDSFDTTIDLSEASTFVFGSHSSLIMQGGVEVKFETTDGTEIGSTVTNGMGAYEYELMSAAIPAGTEIYVVAKDQVIRTLSVQS